MEVEGATQIDSYVKSYYIFLHNKNSEADIL